MAADTIPGAQLAPKALEFAYGFAAAGLHEATGHNDGDQIDKIESFFDLKGEPYCAMGIAFCYMKAYAELTGQAMDRPTLRHILDHDLPRYYNPSPSCGEIVASAKSSGTWQPFTDIDAIHPGDLVLFSFHSGDNRHAEHVGLFDQSRGDDVVCVEFNTSSGAGGSQADGQGCFVRQRHGSVVLGSVHVNKPDPHAAAPAPAAAAAPVAPLTIQLKDGIVIDCHAAVEDDHTRVDMRAVCNALGINPLPSDSALAALRPVVIPPGVTRVDLRPLAENNGWELLTDEMDAQGKIVLQKRA